jgi:prolyl oligopeptidase
VIRVTFSPANPRRTDGTDPAGFRAMNAPQNTRIAAALLVAAGCATHGSTGDSMPATPKRPVVDTYYDVKVTDDYRWLENADDPEVRAWSDAQNARTRETLDHLPSVDAIRARIAALFKADSISYHSLVVRGGTLFAMKEQRPKQQPFLVAMEAAACDPERERVVLDPNALDKGCTTAIDFFVPSLDGKSVAVSLSQDGSESGTVHCYETWTGKEIGEPIPRVNGGTAGGSVAWNADGTGFFYTRYPRGTERPEDDMDFFQQVYFHRLGTPMESDRYEVGKDFPRIAEIQLQTSDDGAWVLASVANGDGGEYAHWLRDPADGWVQVTKFADGAVAAEIGGDGALWLLSRKDAPKGKILRVALDRTPRLAEAKTVVPPGENAIEWFHAAKSRVYVVDQVGGPNAVRVFDNRGGAHGALQLPAVPSVDDVVRCGGDDVLVRTQTYVEAPAWRRLSSADGRLAPTRLSDTYAIDYSDAEVVRDVATSKDGARVPMTIVRKKGAKLDGSNPTLLYGYGGYGICLAPYYMRPLRVWLDQGGVYVVANIRGGGEFGEEWHKAGNLVKKQNVFDDFAACARRLVELGYTKPERLAFEGGSNGGLLMGAMIVQHPDLCRAVVSHVGIYDMLRVETTPNGAFNVTEFGTVKDEAQFKALHAYSPYHHVVDGTAYPAVLFMTGANDPRVDPYNSRKMTARLQAATSSGRPILLRTSANSGHGMGSSLDQRIEEQVDVDAFLFHELGVAFK